MLGLQRHISLDITLSTTNHTWSGTRSGLYKRDVWYSWKYIIPSSWSRMWTGRPTDRDSILINSRAPNCYWGQLASSPIGVHEGKILTIPAKLRPPPEKLSNYIWSSDDDVQRCSFVEKRQVSIEHNASLTVYYHFVSVSFSQHFPCETFCCSAVIPPLSQQYFYS